SNRLPVRKSANPLTTGSSCLSSKNTLIPFERVTVAGSGILIGGSGENFRLLYDGSTGAWRTSVWALASAVAAISTTARTLIIGGSRGCCYCKRERPAVRCRLYSMCWGKG